jgi:hypothetical protein
MSRAEQSESRARTALARAASLKGPCARAECEREPRSRLMPGRGPDGAFGSFLDLRPTEGSFESNPPLVPEFVHQRRFYTEFVHERARCAPARGQLPRAFATPATRLSHRLRLCSAAPDRASGRRGWSSNVSSCSPAHFHLCTCDEQARVKAKVVRAGAKGFTPQQQQQQPQVSPAGAAAASPRHQRTHAGPGDD